MIVLTHLHGDHYLGLPGLLKTYSLLGREEPLVLYGPSGLYEMLHDAERLMGRPRFPSSLKRWVRGRSWKTRSTY